MALILKTVGETFTNANLPLFFRDKIANNGTLDIFDAKDTYSWPKQDNAATTDAWKSLVGANTATFDGTVDWSSGGFVLNGTSDIINIPSSTFKFTTEQRCVIFWFKPTGFTAGGACPLAGWQKTGTGDSPYHMYFQDTDKFVMTVANDLGGQLMHYVQCNTSTVYQAAFSFEKVGGVYRVKSFFNGVLVKTVTGTTGTIADTGIVKIGGGAFTGSATTPARIFRAISDNLSVSTPEALVAADWTAYSSRFS